MSAATPRVTLRESWAGLALVSPALLVIVALGAGIGSARHAVGSPEPMWPITATTFMVHRPVRAGLVTFAFRYPDAEPRSVTLITGDKQAVIALKNSLASLTIRLPPDIDGKVVVQIDPPGSVVVSRQPDVPERAASWRPIPIRHRRCSATR